MKGSMGATEMVLEMVPLDVTIEVKPEPTPSWFPTPAVGPNMMTICGEGGSKSNEESDETKEESVWELGGL